jgi:hypothetical protein
MRRAISIAFTLFMIDACINHCLFGGTAVAQNQLALGRPAMATNQLALSLSERFVDGGGLYALGSSGTLVQAELNYARALVLRARVGLWFKGGSAFGRRTGLLFGTFETSAWLQDITAGLRLTLPIPRLSWLVPQLRAGGGVLVGHLSIDDRASVSASRWSAAGTGYALGGVEIVLPPEWMKGAGRSGFTVGVIVEGGYALASALSFSLRPDQPDGQALIPLRGADLGSLSLNGALLRAGLVVCF